MIDSLFNTLVFCSHRRISFPMTIRRRTHAFSSALCGNQTFVICFDCGKEFSYNWEEMRIEAAEPLVGLRTQRIAISWIRSARAALAGCGRTQKHRFLWARLRIGAPCSQPLTEPRPQGAKQLGAFSRTLLANAAARSYHFLSAQNASTKLTSAICSGIETAASFWYLQPAGFRTVLSRVQVRLYKRGSTKWPAIVKIEVRIQAAIISLKKIVKQSIM
jgi:hypothetical protein